MRSPFILAEILVALVEGLRLAGADEPLRRDEHAQSVMNTRHAK